MIAACEARAAECLRLNENLRPLTTSAAYMARTAMLNEAPLLDMLAATLRNGGGCHIWHGDGSLYATQRDCHDCHGTGVSDAVRELAAKAGL
jgi:hypothetical protein